MDNKPKMSKKQKNATIVWIGSILIFLVLGLISFTDTGIELGIGKFVTLAFWSNFTIKFIAVTISRILYTITGRENQKIDREEYDNSINDLQNEKTNIENDGLVETAEFFVSYELDPLSKMEDYEEYLELKKIRIEKYRWYKFWMWIGNFRYKTRHAKILEIEKRIQDNRKWKFKFNKDSSSQEVRDYIDSIMIRRTSLKYNEIVSEGLPSNKTTSQIIRQTEEEDTRSSVLKGMLFSFLGVLTAVATVQDLLFSTDNWLEKLTVTLITLATIVISSYFSYVAGKSITDRTIMRVQYKLSLLKRFTKKPEVLAIRVAKNTELKYALIDTFREEIEKLNEPEKEVDEVEVSNNVMDDNSDISNDDIPVVEKPKTIIKYNGGNNETTN